MDERPQRLLDQIASAFAGVELGDGVSLHESAVIDNYGTDEERLAARTLDEKHDWHKVIDDPELTLLFSLGYGGLCFLDAEGFRFYLPACLSRWLQDPGGRETGNMTESLEYRLTDFSNDNLERLAILCDAQRLCVRDVFVHFRDTYERDDPELDQAIAGYWSQGT